MTPAVNATYRLQVSRDFTLDDLVPVVDYLQDLGVTHLYLSPLMESAEGSNHGYDGVDFNKISAERGGESALKKLHDRLAAMTPPMRIVLDIVPNHLAAGAGNPYWMDVLKQGRESRFWPLFDLRPDRDGKIVLPVLGDTPERLVESGAIKREGNMIRYGGSEFPVAPGTEGETDLKRLLERQHYRLAFWREVRDAVGYRRFFDVTALVGLRVEDETVRELTHKKIFELLKDYPLIDGLRVDHIDGLTDPAGYLQWLNRKAPHVWVEKILAPGETLPRDWPVHGTTGYEFCQAANQLMVHKDGFDEIEAFWRALQPRWRDFQDAVAEGKDFVLKELFPAELKRLGGDPAFWTGLTVGLPVYRTYGLESDNDKKYIAVACERARKRYGAGFEGAEASGLRGLSGQKLRNWQQLSGPVMAKGLEDTAHYRYTPLAALNEVGCEAAVADNYGTAAFTDWLRDRAARMPDTFNATSTHDTKRSEDVRSRLYGLSAMAGEWIDFYKRAAALNAGFKTGGTPGPAAEYFLYQTVLGVWPPDNRVERSLTGRLQAYMQKASREAKDETGWLDPDRDYEKALEKFIDAIMDHQPFIGLVQDFCARLSPLGALNALTLQALKILSPGIPDIYQGTETWDFSLVDPDNRRPVDYAARKALAVRTQKHERGGSRAAMNVLLNEWTNGAIKQWLTRKLLRLRAEIMHPAGRDLAIAPLEITLPDCFIACMIRAGRQKIVMILPRNCRASPTLRLPPETMRGMTVSLEDAGAWIDVLSGEAVTTETLRRPAAALEQFPLLIARTA